MARQVIETGTAVLELVVLREERALCHGCGVAPVALGTLDGPDGELMEYRCPECGEHSLPDVAGARRRVRESA